MAPKFKLSIQIIIIVLVIAAAIWWFQPTTNNSFARSSWHSGGEPMTAAFTVLDSQGHPLPGAKVHAWNTRGYTEGITGTNGVTTIRFGEPALIAIDVDGNRVIDRTFMLQSTLYIADGLKVHIQLK